MSEPPRPSSNPANPLLSYQAPVDVLLDKVQLGFEVLLRDVSVEGARAFCADLAASGVLVPRPLLDGELVRPLTIGPFAVPLAENGRGTLDGQLSLAEAKGGHLVITNRSHLVLNAMRDLRTQLEVPGAEASDGNDNVVWEHGEEWQHLLGFQLANVVVMVDAFLDAVARAAKMDRERLRGRVWVQQGEVCRDHGVADAEAVVRELAASPIPRGPTSALRWVLERKANFLCVAWHEDSGTAPERKVYAKRKDLLRIEIAVRRRPAVKSLLRRRETISGTAAGLDGTEVSLLLADLALAAAPLLDRAAEHIDTLSGLPQRAGADLVVGFAPLIHLIAPVVRPGNAGGRPREPSVPGRARRALDLLLSTGSFHARGLGDKDAVLLALREMVSSGTLAKLPRGDRFFTVSPGLEAARRALAEARRSDDALPEAAGGEDPAGPAG